MPSIKDEISNRLFHSPHQYHRFTIILNPDRQSIGPDIKNVLEDLGIVYINLGLSLSQLLLELTERQRSLRLVNLIDQVLSSYEGMPVLLDHIEVLFTPQLNQDPLRLLQGLSRNRDILAVWNGHIDKGFLTYASPDHPEYRRYPIQDLTILSLSDYLD